MFTLITGAPGSGKTSHLLLKLKDVKDRPIYYRGIRNLKLPWIELTDEEAFEWYKHLPDGAILVIDEVQDIYPQRPHTRPAPEGCSILSRHRHRGWDIYFVTQTPMALDHEARKYVNEHIHYSRSFGAPVVTEYHKGNGVIDLSDKWALKNDVNKRQRRLPKQVWDLYHSAEVHTHQFRVPTKLYALPVVLLVLLFLGWRAVAWYDGMKAKADEIHERAAPAGSVAPGASGDIIVTGDAIDVVEWARLLKPEIPGLPYTAPIYAVEARKPKAIPIVQGCMSIRPDYSDCSCYTQQGTRIMDMPNSICVQVLKYGIFDHLKPDSDLHYVAHRDVDMQGVGQESARKGEGLPARARH